MKNKFVNLSIIIVSLMPVMIWLAMESLSLRFSGVSAILTSIGQLTGLVGMALFSVNLLLINRFKFLDRWFGGLGRMYIDHHRLGGIALILLLIHPVALAVRFIPSSIEVAASFFIPESGNIAKSAGIIGLALMAMLLYFTFYYRPRYELWKLSHRFLGLAFFFGGLHVFFVASDVSRSLWLRSYMLGLIVLAIASIIYRLYQTFVVRKIHPYVVKSVNRPSDQMTELVLEPKSAPMAYKAGQYAFLSFAGIVLPKESHPFSMTSAPSDPLSFVIKDLGDLTSRVHELSPGNEVAVEGPYGQFSYQNFKNKRQIWIAGGVGMTPFLSMLRALGKDEGYQIDFYYCIKNMGEAVFIEEIQRLGDEKGVKVVAFCSDEKGRIDADAIRSMSEGFAGADFLLCGPLGMMSGLRRQLIKAGIKKSKIHSEEFSL